MFRISSVDSLPHLLVLFDLDIDFAHKPEVRMIVIDFAHKPEVRMIVRRGQA